MIGASNKNALREYRTTKPQTSLRSHLSGLLALIFYKVPILCRLFYKVPILCTLFYKVPILCRRTAKILNGVRGFAGCSGSSLFVYVLRSLFSAAGLCMINRFCIYFCIIILISYLNDNGIAANNSITLEIPIKIVWRFPNCCLHNSEKSGKFKVVFVFVCLIINCNVVIENSIHFAKEAEMNGHTNIEFRLQASTMPETNTLTDYAAA